MIPRGTVRGWPSGQGEGWRPTQGAPTSSYHPEHFSSDPWTTGKHASDLCHSRGEDARGLCSVIAGERLPGALIPDSVAPSEWESQQSLQPEKPAARAGGAQSCCCQSFSDGGLGRGARL